MAPTGDPPFGYNPYNQNNISPGPFNQEQSYGPGPYGPRNTIMENIHNGVYTTNSIGAINVAFEKEIIDQLAKQVATEIDREILNGLKENFQSSIMEIKQMIASNNTIWPNGIPINVAQPLTPGQYAFNVGPNMPPAIPTYMSSGSISMGTTVAAPQLGIDPEALKKEIKNALMDALAVEKQKEHSMRLAEKAQEKAEAAKTKISRQDFENIVRNILQEQENIKQQEQIAIMESEIGDFEDQITELNAQIRHLDNVIENLEDELLLERAKKAGQEAVNKKLFSSYQKRTGIKGESISASKMVEKEATTVVTLPSSTIAGTKITVTPYKVESVKTVSRDDSSIKMEVEKMEDEFDSDLEEEEMEEEEKGIVQTLKDDSKLVAKRVAARKVVNVARDLLVSMMSAGKTKKEANNIKNTIGLMLQTDDGKAVLSFMLGAMLPLILAQLPEKYHSVARDMAQEFRVEGMAHFGTMLADFVTGPAFQTAKGLITSALDEAIDTKEEKTTGVRVASDLKHEHAKDHAKHDDAEEAEVKTNHKRNNHATS